MTCKKCGYRNDFLKTCPFHEKPLEERIKAIRAKQQEEPMDVKEIREAIEGLLHAANRNVGGMAPGVIASWCHKAIALIDAPVASDALELAKDIVDDVFTEIYGAIGRTAIAIESFAAERERKAVDQFWKELHEEAEVHCDRRIELLGKIETIEDAAIRKAMLDGWSAWVLAKRIVFERNKRAAILQAESGQGNKQ